MRDREKELKYLIYLKNELIKQEKKELKILRQELYEISQSKQKVKKHKNI